MNLSARPKNYQFMAILAIIVGIILVIYPTTALTLVIVAIGALLLLSAIASIVDYYKLKKHNLHPSSSMIINGVMSTIVGVILIVSPLFFVNFLLTLLSILLLLGSIGQFITLAYGRSKGAVIPIYMFIVPVLLLILSIVMLTAPQESAVTITSMFGFGIIIYSAMELISLYVIKKIEKE